MHLLLGIGARSASYYTGTIMANEVNIPKPDRAENRGTYDRFMSISKNATIFIVVVLVLMAVFLV